MNFVTIDVETANEDLASICQIGLVRFKDSKISNTFTSLINPQDSFSSMNTFIHGIEKKHVINSPIFPEIYEQICDFFQEDVLVCHTHFDRSAWNKTLERYALPVRAIKWLDSARVVRRTWEEYSTSGYGLSNVCQNLGIEFKHHDALEDARAAGLVLIQACNKTGLNVSDWLARVQLPIDISAQALSVKREGNPDGALFGETVVFTGALCIPRQEAANLAARAGCNVGTDVTKKTTLLVVGDQDIKKLKPGESKSNKHAKAEKLIASGHDIRILQESDFVRIVSLS